MMSPRILDTRNSDLVRVSNESGEHHSLLVGPTRDYPAAGDLWSYSAAILAPHRKRENASRGALELVFAPQATIGNRALMCCTVSLLVFSGIARGNKGRGPRVRQKCRMAFRSAVGSVVGP